MVFAEPTENVHANLYLQAAADLGLDCEVTDVENAKYTIRGRGKILMAGGGTLDVNKPGPALLAGNKFFVSQLLLKKGWPAPLTEIFPMEWSAAEVLAEARNSFPLVTKPISGYGGKGIRLNIRSEEELDSAIRLVRDLPDKIYRESILVENFVAGKDYRALLFRGRVIDILERTPARVFGDGVKTLQQLIEDKNEVRLAFHHTMTSIELDEELHLLLDSVDMTLDSVPEVGECVQLRRMCNFEQGGTVTTFPIDRVHPDNLEMFQRIQDVARLEMCGVDFITPDIGVSHRDVPCCVNEINNRPGIQIHCFADPHGIYLEPAGKILQDYFFADEAVPAAVAGGG